MSNQKNTFIQSFKEDRFAKYLSRVYDTTANRLFFFSVRLTSVVFFTFGRDMCTRRPKTTFVALATQRFVEFRMLMDLVACGQSAWPLSVHETFK